MAWLGTWAKRIEITISNTNVDSALSNFPVLLYLSTSSGTGPDDVSCVFDELAADANRKKIAVTTSDGQTQCYVEIERWDDANEKAWLWVKVPSISDSAPTTIYLYYDSAQSENTTYVGDTGDAAAQNVWDSFHLVYHLNQDPSGGAECILDSTSNANHGTPAGTMTSGDLVDGQIAKALDFDGTDDEINFKNMISDSTMTIELLYNCTGYGLWEMFCGKDGATTDFFGFYDTSNWCRIRANNSDGDVTKQLNTGQYDHIAAILDGTNYRFMLDGVSQGTDGQTQTLDIDTLAYGFTVATYHFTGKICEFRISSIARSQAWVKATHYSFDDGIVDFGSEEVYVEDVEITADPITITLSQIGAWFGDVIITATSIDISITQVGTYSLYLTAEPIEISVSQSNLGRFVAGIDFSPSSVISIPITVSGSFLRTFQTDWRAFKNQDPWTLPDHKDKYGYLNNPNWTGEEGVSDFLSTVGLSNKVDLENEHTPCGHWHKKLGAYYKYQGVETGRWLAAKDQEGTPYIYLYDITYRSVIRIDTSMNPPQFVGRLIVNDSANYYLDCGGYTYDEINQQGGYCINKGDGKRLWYLFRGINAELGNYKLVEVDIDNTGDNMTVERTTVFSSFGCPNGTKIVDGCSNNDYTFWATNEVKGRIIKIRNSDHALIDDHYFNYSSTYEHYPEAIAGIDCHISEQALYWSYVVENESLVPSSMYIKADYDLGTIADYEWKNIYSKWQHSVRVFGDYVYFHRHFIYTHTYTLIMDLDLTPLHWEDHGNFYGENFVQGYDGSVFWMGKTYQTVPYARIYKSRRDTMDTQKVLDGQYDANYYCGYGQAPPVGAPWDWDWDQTFTAALCKQTGILMIFRYDEESSPQANIGVAYDADLDFISDTRYPNQMFIGGYDGDAIIDDEPQIWPFEEQPNKFGYLNNPNWTGEEGVADFLSSVGLSNKVDLENEHAPCGHWHKEPLETYSIEYEATVNYVGVIDSYEWRTSNVSNIRLVHVAGDIYAIAALYDQGDEGLYIVTIEVDSAGNITDPKIDEWRAVASPYFNSGGDLIKIYGGSGPYAFACVYAESHFGNNKTNLKTFTINSDGTINKSFIDTEVIGPTGCNSSPYSIGRITGNIYALAYVYGTQSSVVTYLISSSGMIGSQLDSCVFESSATPGPFAARSIHEGNGLFGVVYWFAKSIPDPERYKTTIAVLKISGGGVISKTDSYDLLGPDPSAYSYVSTVNLFDLSWSYGIAVVYTEHFGSLNRKLFTFDVSANGILTFKDSATLWDADTAFHPSMIKCVDDGDKYFYVPHLTGMAAIEIESDGEITGSSDLVTGLNFGHYSNVIQLSEDVFGVAYRDATVDGWFKTFDIDVELVGKRVKDSEPVDPADDEPVIWPLN